MIYRGRLFNIRFFVYFEGINLCFIPKNEDFRQKPTYFET